VIDPALRPKFEPLLASLLNDAKTAGGLRVAALRALPLTGPENAKANFAILADHLNRTEDRTEAARGILQLQRDSWDKATAGSLAEGILAWAKSVPASDRTKQDFIEVVQTGNELASLLPPADAARIKKELRSLGVSVFVVKTVREQMRYDTPRLVVEAGKPFEVIFENMDAMGHNFVVVQPGTRQAVAEAVQTRRPDQLDKKGRAYVPEDGRNQDKRVLDATKMVEPGQKETLKMSAPGKEGEYEYVCTMPGHWVIMWGKLIVTKNVDAYLQAHPTAEPTGVEALLPK
jgi:azurin